MRIKWLQGAAPGIIVAATGLGAGDIVTAATAGASFGVTLLWAVAFGGILKFCLTEGIGRWQLATGKTFLEGWIDHLPAAFSWYFLAYLALWTFMVAGAMMAACGLAAYAFFPGLSVAWWGALHALAAFALVYFGAYRALEGIMKFFIGLMFIAILYCAVLVLPAADSILSGLLVPRLPQGSMAYVLGIIGGVGGSITIMSYGYWMREAGWEGQEKMSLMRLDLAIAYGLTALFGLAVMVIAAGVQPEVASGNNMALALAEQLAEAAGPTGKWVFLFGFWGAVFSSMVGVWHGVPFLFANFVYCRQRKMHLHDSQHGISKTPAYRGYLLYLSFLPMLLLLLQRPVWIVILYAATGALFMPLLAALLLYLNGAKRWLGLHCYGWQGKTLLACCLLMFGYLLVIELRGLLA